MEPIQQQPIEQETPQTPPPEPIKEPETPSFADEWKAAIDGIISKIDELAESWKGHSHEQRTEQATGATPEQPIVLPITDKGTGLGTEIIRNVVRSGFRRGRGETA